MLQLILSVVAVGIFKFVANFPPIILLSITIILHQIFRCLSACLKANSWLLQDEQPEPNFYMKVFVRQQATYQFAQLW